MLFLEQDSLLKWDRTGLIQLIRGASEVVAEQ